MRNVTLKQLRTLSAIVRRGTMAGAAEELHLTPPAVTIQMRHLEEEVGLPLLERTAEGMRPTPAGQEVVATAFRIEAALEECAGMVAEIKGLARGRISVGVVSTAKYFAPRALAAFARAHPDVDLRLSIGNRGETIAALTGYDVELAIMGRPPETLEVDREVIGDHPHVLIAPPDHPKAGCGRMPLAAIAGETFLMREPGSGTRMLAERLLGDGAIAPKVGMEISSNETIKQAVMAGLGIALISAHTAAAELADRRLVALEVEGLPIVRTWFVVKRSNRRLLPAPQSLWNFLAAEGKRFLPTTF